MKRSYLNLQAKGTGYIYNKTYIDSGSQDIYDRVYQILPEEYDVFSKIDKKYFSVQDSEQDKYVAHFLIMLKEELRDLLAHQGIVKILPKLHMSIDEDDAVVLNWAYVNYRIFFNFERNANESYYGIVTTNDSVEYSSTVGQLNHENFQNIIAKVLKYICENS